MIHLNGRLMDAEAARIDPADRGLLLADGLFETLRACRGRPLALDAHLHRLAIGARTLELRLPAPSEIEAAVVATLAANGHAEAVVRVTVTRGTGPRGLALPAVGTDPTWMVSTTPSPSPPPDGWTARVASIRRNEHSPLSRLKSLACLDSVLALRGAATVGADEALMLNSAGRVACGSRSNLFLVRERTVVTPPESEGVLPGVTRAQVMKLALGAGLEAREEPVSLADLLEASEVFVTNSVIALVPLRRIDDRPLSRGPITAELTHRYEAWAEAATS